MTTTKNLPTIPTMIKITVDHSATGLDLPTRDALHHLAKALDHRCDAIGECGCRCTLRAGHPGEIHEQYAYGSSTRFRLTLPAWAIA